ncbi:MAG TPA: HYExAFE family protein [Phycisphaerae bacterium]|nr:HYExAFE family protein [Phycisphaerae bacterium]
MANRKVIYEAGFEDYLRTVGVPYVAVNEAKKAILAGVQLKSFDFVVYSSTGPNLLVDVKGRRFAACSGRGGRLENWATRDDLDSLARWQEVFGSGFAALLVFCYHVIRPEAASRFEVVHLFRGNYFGLVGVYRDAYAGACRRRSLAWDTVSVPTAEFGKMIRPINSFL